MKMTFCYSLFDINVCNCPRIRYLVKADDSFFGVSLASLLDDWEAALHLCMAYNNQY